MASNHSWVVPAGLEERRFFVLDVSDKKTQNHEYFAPIYHQMNEQGGKDAMLYDLMNRDISGVNLRTFPQTEALFEQKLHNMEPLILFWYERLNEGRLLSEQGSRKYEEECSHVDQQVIEEYRTKWNDTIVTQVLYTGFEVFLSTTQKKAYLDSSLFVRKLRKICPGIVTRKREKISGSSKKVGFLKIPPLIECRKAFEDLMREGINWETGDDVDYTYTLADAMKN